MRPGSTAHGSFWCIKGSCSLIELDAGTPDQVRIGTSDCVGLVPMGRETLMTVSGNADLDLADIVTGRTAKLGALALRHAVRGAVRGDETTTYVAVGIQHGSTAIVAVEFEVPAVEVVARAFAASDSGDLAGAMPNWARRFRRSWPTSIWPFRLQPPCSRMSEPHPRRLKTEPYAGPVRCGGLPAGGERRRPTPRGRMMAER